jgi:hypothetical protein
LTRSDQWIHDLLSTLLWYGLDLRQPMMIELRAETDVRGLRSALRSDKPVLPCVRSIRIKKGPAVQAVGCLLQNHEPHG